MCLFYEVGYVATTKESNFMTEKFAFKQAIFVFMEFFCHGFRSYAIFLELKDLLALTSILTQDQERYS